MIRKNDAYLQKFNKTFTQRWLSDLHLDSKYTDKKKVKRLFDEAKEKGYQINIIGDLFDIMGMRMDFRSTKSDIKEALREENYVNLVVQEVAEFLAPYVDCIGIITVGNHEKEFEKRAELYLLEVLNLYLHKMTGKEVLVSNEYAGYIIMIGRKNEDNNSSASCTIFFNHGKDSNAAMSLGALNVKRNAATIDADIFISGHIHRNLLAPLNRVYCSAAGIITVKEQLHIQLGTAKESKGVDYFSARKGFDPASTSFYDITFNLNRINEQGRDTLRMEYIEQRVKL
jgi:UDP-2,3-diacylglucosamine pyrophosphatase LpxH